MKCTQFGETIILGFPGGTCVVCYTNCDILQEVAAATSRISSNSRSKSSSSSNSGVGSNSDGCGPVNSWLVVKCG